MVIRLSAWGDILLAADFTRHLSQSYRVVFVTATAYQKTARILPGVSDVFCLDKNLPAPEKKQLIAQLNQLQPALVFDLQNKLRTIIFRRQIRAQRYVTLSKRTWQQGLMALFGSDTVLDHEHQSQRYLNVLETNKPTEKTPPTIQTLPNSWGDSVSTSFFANGPAPDKPTVGLAFGATHPTKGWPIAHLIKLIEILQNEVNWILVGGPNDNDRMDKIRSILGEQTPKDTCQCSLEELTSLISQMHCLIGVDTGPMHLARLRKVPTLTLFGPTSVKRWGPGPFTSSQHRTVSLDLACQPCSNHGGTLCPLEHHACMKDLQPELVAEQARAILGDRL